MLDKAFGAVNKAKNADTVVFTLSRFEEFPDLWISDTTLQGHEEGVEREPAAAAVSWGRSELIEYVNADGKKLRAILTKPENFDPTKKYPLMVYIYEELTQGLHSLARRTSAPASTSPATSATATSCCGPTSSTRPATRGRAPRSASSRRSTPCSRWASSIRSASASRGTRGAATRSPTWSRRPTCSPR